MLFGNSMTLILDVLNCKLIKISPTSKSFYLSSKNFNAYRGIIFPYKHYSFQKGWFPNAFKPSNVVVSKNITVLYFTDNTTKNLQQKLQKSRK